MLKKESKNNKEPKEKYMKTIKNRCAKFVGPFACGLALAALAWACISAWGQTLPGLSIAVTGTNEVSLTVTNGVGSTQYQIYYAESLNNPDWLLWTNGTIGQTNFTVDVSDFDIIFFKAVNNTNFAPPVINVVIQSPANGSVIY